MYDLYEMKDKRWMVTDTISSLDEVVTKFGAGNVRLVARGFYSIHSDDAIMAMLVECSLAD